MNNYRRNSKPHSRLLPYATIREASEGDPDAVNAVLRHYEGYITRLAMRQLHDEYGNTYIHSKPWGCRRVVMWIPRSR